MADDPVELNQTQMAQVFGVTVRTIRRWEKEGLPARRDGSQKLYPLALAIRWERERAVEAALKEVEITDVDAVRLRKLEAEAESKELDLQQKRGELVPIDQVETLLREALESVDSLLRHAPSRFAPKLAKAAELPIKRARTILEDVIELVRGSLREGKKSA